jgi:hypothetical protein
MTTVFLKSTVPPAPIRQPAVVEQLQHHVQDFRMCLLDFIEEHDRIGTPADGLRQLTGLFVADVAGRRADQPGDAVFLLILGHVDAHHRVLIVEQELRERTGELGLADARRSQKDETAQRAVRILQSGARAANGVRDRGHGLVLADHALVQPLFHLDELLHSPSIRRLTGCASSARRRRRCLPRRPVP